VKPVLFGAGILASVLTLAFYFLPGMRNTEREGASQVDLGAEPAERGPELPPVVVALAALAFDGHASQVPSAEGAIFVDFVHVLSAGMWAGGILVLATLFPPGGWGGSEGRALLQRFGRVAFLAFAITALTGALRATAKLRGLSDLWTTEYGLVLSAKMAGVAVMVAMSALMWRRGAQSARYEGLVVLLVLAATAALAVSPIHPGQG